jgi:Domain of unknown function (DUF4170)
MSQSEARSSDNQLLHLVFGGELEDVQGVRFSDLDRLDIVGVYPNYRTAYDAWRARAQGSVDNARMRYFIVHLHRLLDPEATGAPSGGASRPSDGR